MTISFVLIVHWSFLHIRWLTGGASGFSVPHPNYGGLPIPNTQATYYLSLLTLLGALWVVRNLVASSFGRSLLCLAEQEIVAPGLGINVFSTKITVFALSGLLAGLAGGLHAITLQFIDPQNFWLLQLVIQLCMVALGGVASPARLRARRLDHDPADRGPPRVQGPVGIRDRAPSWLGDHRVLSPRDSRGLVEHYFPSLRERRHGP